MHRREIIRYLFLGLGSAKTILANAAPIDNTTDEPMPVNTVDAFKSRWHYYEDMPWTGEELWAQRLQDWCIKDGKLNCLVHGENRTVHLLTHQLSDQKKSFSATVELQFLNPIIDATTEQYVGLRIGVQGKNPDYRSAIFAGTGLDVGVTRNGFLFIGNTKSNRVIDENILQAKVKLSLTVIAQKEKGYFIKLKALDKAGNTIETLSQENETNNLEGNIAIVSHTKTPKDKAALPSVAFYSFTVSGDKLSHHPKQTYGAIYFAQYTVNANTLKLTAQLAPIDKPGAEVQLYVRKNDTWKKIASSTIHPLARIATFKIDNWNSTKPVIYKVEYVQTVKNRKPVVHSYMGTIAAEPVANKVKALAFSCNWDLGFPDNEVVENATLHKADMAFFLGDQFYESNGGFGVQTNTLEKATLDYLRKWYMFGWSYRNLFRHIPMVALLDDHDVYHGNIWGAGGRPTNPALKGAEAQDSGGYKMPPDWVNMAQLTQTSHMPQAFDNNSAAQGINVYYTEWLYGGISFGIIEDRKFKSPPKEVLPQEAKVYNGFVQQNFYDKTKENELTTQLIGERQINFLQQWVNKKNKNEAFKVLVSATPFCCLQTMPANETNDQHNPDFSIPQKGEYIQGDKIAKDMDSNGWPHNRRDEVLTILKNKVNLHLVGDQHLPSVVHYGVNQFEDNIFCFAVPALNNIWPRRWWPSAEVNLKPMQNKPAYTGNFLDGFDNKITVHAVANPHVTGKEPAKLYDRVTGYGVVEFDKKNNTITLNCWPRYVNPTNNNKQQYEGWPLQIKNATII
jgi:alkaline phosphatase D